MAKKNKRKKALAPVPTNDVSETPAGGSNPVRYVAIALLTLGAGVFLYASLGDSGSQTSGIETSPSSPSGQSRTTNPTESERFRYHDSEEDARPFPVTLPPSHFSNEGIARTCPIAKGDPGRARAATLLVRGGAAEPVPWAVVLEPCTA